MNRNSRLRQLEADLANSSGRVVRIAELWTRDENGESKLDRHVDLRTDDLLELLRERRELRARLLEELALRVGTSDVIDPSLAAGWNDARDERWAERRAVCLLRHYAQLIREGRR